MQIEIYAVYRSMGCRAVKILFMEIGVRLFNGH